MKNNLYENIPSIILFGGSDDDLFGKWKIPLYRLSFGQPLQEELVEALYREYKENILNIVREKLIINLSLITYKN